MSDNATAAANEKSKKRYVRSRVQRKGYAVVKRANYFLAKYGEGRKKFWRVGLKPLSQEIYEMIRYDETKKKPFFIYDSRKPKRTPLRAKGNLDEHEVWDLISPGKPKEQMMKDVAAIHKSQP